MSGQEPQLKSFSFFYFFLKSSRGFISLNKQKIIKYFGFKLVRFIILMVAVAIFSFVLLDLSPIDPVSAYLKGAAVS